MDIRFLTRGCAVHPLFSTAKDFLLGGRPSSSKTIVWSMSGDVGIVLGMCTFVLYQKRMLDQDGL